METDQSSTNEPIQQQSLNNNNLNNSELDSFEKVFSAFKWFEIPNCPGRYVMKGGNSMNERKKDPLEFLHSSTLLEVKAKSSICRDPSIRIVLFRNGDGSGLLSYEKPEGGFVHTLNTPSGMKRKLAHLQIPFPNQT